MPSRVRATTAVSVEASEAPSAPRADSAASAPSTPSARTGGEGDAGLFMGFDRHGVRAAVADDHHDVEILR